MPRTLVLLLTLSASPLVAQNPLVGGWQISFPGAVRVENGVATTTQATGVLTIAAEGDSLIGNLVADPVAGRPSRPPLRLAGMAGAAKTILVSRSKATLMRNGVQSEATVLMTWTLWQSGDGLEGTLERWVEGEEDGGTGPQPVTGKRVQG